MVQDSFNNCHFFILEPKQSAFTGQWLLIAAVIGICSFQCSWTPNIETVLHESPDAFISLQTTQALKIAPKHPSSISETLLKKILGGITIKQEGGMLQQLLLAAPSTAPVFSPPQIEFLAFHLSTALSKATAEEIVFFRFPASNEQSAPIEGTVAVFDPTYLLLTLSNTNKPNEMTSKIEKTSQKLQTTTLLAFSQKEASMRSEEAETYLTIPPTSHRIVIDYKLLTTSGVFEPHNQQNQPPQHGMQIIHDEKIGTPMEMKKLREQLKNLQKTVDQQRKEIRRLQHMAPP